MRFTRHIGIDYSGAQTPESRLKALQLYEARNGNAPIKVNTPTESARNWTRFEVAQFCAAAIETGEPVIIGIDHAFSFPMTYMHRFGIETWDQFLDDFMRHWPTCASRILMQPLEDNNDGAPERPRIRQPDPVRLTVADDRPAYSGPKTGAFARDGTSRQLNPHITESREVCYPWHAWYGQRVVIRESLVKGGQPIFRCAIEPGNSVRSLEVPVWMFDNAECYTMRLFDVPVVSVEALFELKALLGKGALSNEEPVIKGQHHSSISKGDADAMVTVSPTPQRTPQWRTLPVEVRQATTVLLASRRVTDSCI